MDELPEEDQFLDTTMSYCVRVFTLILLTFTTTSLAGELQDLSGIVIRIVDGDTIVLESQGDRHRVRLSGIDAPERNQPWGDVSTRELRRQIAGKAVVVEWRKRDRWKRIIGVIKLKGNDVNKHMVERGLAWHYKKYQSEQTPEDRVEYAAAETAAQGAKRGLWSVSNSIPPWAWRRRK